MYHRYNFVRTSNHDKNHAILKSVTYYNKLLGVCTHFAHKRLYQPFTCSNISMSNTITNFKLS